jgi:hypothetical protein
MNEIVKIVVGSWHLVKMQIQRCGYKCMRLPRLAFSKSRNDKKNKAPSQ